jgi:hypothetical protein
LTIFSWSSCAELDQEDVASQSAEGRKETSESQFNEISDETAQTHGIDQEIIIEDLSEGDKLLAINFEYYSCERARHST